MANGETLDPMPLAPPARESGQGWTVTGTGSRRIAAVRVTLPAASAHVPWTPRCDGCNGYCGTCVAAVRDEGGPP